MDLLRVRHTPFIDDRCIFHHITSSSMNIQVPSIFVNHLWALSQPHFHPRHVRKASAEGISRARIIHHAESRIYCFVSGKLVNRRSCGKRLKRGRWGP